uniref:Uncharacterized protein n=1 Tax=Anguilla anguilla TaxID=7936 RepID=A0A0E9Q6A6_ANGAN
MCGSKDVSREAYSRIKYLFILFFMKPSSHDCSYLQVIRLAVVQNDVPRY